jgi:hypothetical protein
MYGGGRSLSGNVNENKNSMFKQTGSGKTVCIYL